MAGENRARVHICGDEYILKGDADKQYISYLGNVVDRKMREIQARNADLPRHRLAILTAFNLADELEKTRQENKELLDLIKELK